eukprot:361145_1
MNNLWRAPEGHHEAPEVDYEINWGNILIITLGAIVLLLLIVILCLKLTLYYKTDKEERRFCCKPRQRNKEGEFNDGDCEMNSLEGILWNVAFCWLCCGENYSQLNLCSCDGDPGKPGPGV